MFTDDANEIVIIANLSLDEPSLEVVVSTDEGTEDRMSPLKLGSDELFVDDSP